MRSWGLTTNGRGNKEGRGKEIEVYGIHVGSLERVKKNQIKSQ